ncbi:hypothetical protein VOLCADRAFT_97596 [Volvox carteri f. nagariensis]|uniref:Uncharacterized protein n=1 Tax=Volvox carteri f. nagariensis TaxID=3068 RepID=D8UD49_VOLCA|nr:uncharacterized protein VOLCADRAFT_97596 [Volvox carteri f. nagariensis]EFJ42370.1 hypothetical protein VOLCADRAFT_97596 [Volvox carteri f. nagariensis]|eukprot:XP_002956603.1 hypothetical protein VOLCADRAFT_97596 [Volvox carteri f. nagariensis]
MLRYASWIEALDHVPGLNLAEKSRARIIILSKPREDRELYFQGTYAEVAATIKALLRETPEGNISASPGPTALRLTLCAEAAALEANLESLRPSSTNVSSCCTSASLSSRPSTSQILVQTAASVPHLGFLPEAFRAARFRATQPGDIFCRTVKELVPAADGGASLTRTRIKFAMAVNVYVPPPPSSASSASTSSSSSSFSSSSPSPTLASPSSSFTALSRSPSSFSSFPSSSPRCPCKASASRAQYDCSNETTGVLVIAVRIRTMEVSRRSSSRNQQHPEEYEAEVVPDPADSFAAVSEGLDQGAVRAAQVLWWQGSPVLEPVTRVSTYWSHSPEATTAAWHSIPPGQQQPRWS